MSFDLDLSYSGDSRETVYELPNIWAMGASSAFASSRFISGRAIAIRGGRWSFAISRNGRDLQVRQLSPVTQGGADLGRWQVQTVKAFATAITQQVLGNSSMAEPYARRTVASLLGPMLANPGGTVRVSRTDLAAHIREINPDLPELLKNSLDVEYLGEATWSHREPVLSAHVGPTSERLVGSGSVNWGYASGGPVELAELMLAHLENTVDGLKDGARLHGDVRHVVVSTMVAPATGQVVIFPAADLAALVLTQFPEMVEGGPSGDIRSRQAQREAAFVALERTSLGEVRQQTEFDGSAVMYLGDGWRSSRDLASYSVLVIFDEADTVNVYAAKGRLQAIGAFAPDASEFPANTEVLVLGRGRVDVQTTERGRVADMKWLTDMKAEKGRAGDLDALIAEVETRSIPTAATRAKWNSRSPYPYEVRLNEFRSTHLDEFGEAVDVSLGNDWRDANGRQFEAAWSPTTGYIYAVESLGSADEAPSPRAKVAVLGRLATDAEMSFAVDCAPESHGEIGGMEVLTEAIGVQLLTSHSPHYAFGIKGPVVEVGRTVAPTLT